MATEQQIARKSHLVAELGRQRQAMSLAKVDLKHRINPLYRVKSSISRSPQKWLAGSIAAAAGLGMLSKSSPKSQNEVRKKSLLTVAIIALAKPYVKAWAIGKATTAIKNFAEKRHSQRTLPPA